MKIGGRELSVMIAALFKPQHFIAAGNMLRVYRHPFEAFGRYLLGRGEYPASIEIKASSTPLTLKVYSHDDILTINEIFCRHDYPTSARDKVIVDFGSNIGISAAYFLTAAPDAYIYLFEPLSSNIDRLRENLRQFEGRYALHEVAIARADGEVQFGWEETGRYGGVGQQTGNYLSVPCWDSNRVLKEIISRHGRIDILKIDIETLERQVTEDIPLSIARDIDRIYVEHDFGSNPLYQTHSYRQYGWIARFVNKRRIQTWNRGRNRIPSGSV